MDLNFDAISSSHKIIPIVANHSCVSTSLRHPFSFSITLFEIESPLQSVTCCDYTSVNILHVLMREAEVVEMYERKFTDHFARLSLTLYEKHVHPLAILVHQSHIRSIPSDPSSMPSQTSVFSTKQKPSKYLQLRFVIYMTIAIAIPFTMYQFLVDVDRPYFGQKAKRTSIFGLNLPSEGFNDTHMWSMRFADESFFRVASRIPCKAVEYEGGPGRNRVDPCNASFENEFTVRNSLLAQKWMFEHQNPRDCSNKSFAVIQNFAVSGYGSVMHQVAWAFGAALAQNRIAIYQRPSNWVSR
jgi:hypothetical protein